MGGTILPQPARSPPATGRAGRIPERRGPAGPGRRHHRPVPGMPARRRDVLRPRTGLDELENQPPAQETSRCLRRPGGQHPDLLPAVAGRAQEPPVVPVQAIPGTAGGRPAPSPAGTLGGNPGNRLPEDPEPGGPREPDPRETAHPTQGPQVRIADRRFPLRSSRSPRTARLVVLPPDETPATAAGHRPEQRTRRRTGRLVPRNECRETGGEETTAQETPALEPARNENPADTHRRGRDGLPAAGDRPGLPPSIRRGGAAHAGTPPGGYA